MTDPVEELSRKARALSPEDHVTNFSQFGLTAPILRSLEDLGFEEPTPVQARALPILLAGRDMVAQALTGSTRVARKAGGPRTLVAPDLTAVAGVERVALVRLRDVHHAVGHHGSAL